jgi:glycerol kinase
LSWKDIAAVGIANQGETSMAWSADGARVFAPALSWEDRRTAEFCRSLAGKGVDSLIRSRTGIMLDPYFSASKFNWLARQSAELRTAHLGHHLRLGGTDSFVIYQLTRGAVHATDPGTASRTALFDIRRLTWDDDLLGAFELSRGWLPEIRPTCGTFGLIDHHEIPAAVPITADVVDAHAALFAQACFDARAAKATFGTGAFIEVNTGRQLLEPDGRLPVFIAWQLGSGADYTMEGGVFSVGSAIDWTTRMGWFGSAADTARLALTVHDTAGVIFIPGFIGLAAPHWISEAKALLTGIGLDTTPAHLARALLDGIAFASGEVIRTLNTRLRGTLAEIRADGGPSRNEYLMQRLADVLGMAVVAAEQPDMTALGAALLAAVGAKQMTLGDVASLPRRARTYEPTFSEDERMEAWNFWQRGISTVKTWSGQ